MDEKLPTVEMICAITDDDEHQEIQKNNTFQEIFLMKHTFYQPILAHQSTTTTKQPPPTDKI